MRDHKQERPTEDPPDRIAPEPVGASRAAVICEGPMHARELVPGDLFSTHGPGYWRDALDPQLATFGQQCYIRTNLPTDYGAPTIRDGDTMVYRLMIGTVHAADSREER